MCSKELDQKIQGNPSNWGSHSIEDVQFVEVDGLRDIRNNPKYDNRLFDLGGIVEIAKDLKVNLPLDFRFITDKNIEQFVQNCVLTAANNKNLSGIMDDLAILACGELEISQGGSPIRAFAVNIAGYGSIGEVFVQPRKQYLAALEALNRFLDEFKTNPHIIEGPITWNTDTSILPLDDDWSKSVRLAARLTLDRCEELRQQNLQPVLYDGAKIVIPGEGDSEAAVIVPYCTTSGPLSGDETVLGRLAVSTLATTTDRKLQTVNVADSIFPTYVFPWQGVFDNGTSYQLEAVLPVRDLESAVDYTAFLQLPLGNTWFLAVIAGGEIYFNAHNKALLVTDNNRDEEGYAGVVASAGGDECKSRFFRATKEEGTGANRVAERDVIGKLASESLLVVAMSTVPKDVADFNFDLLLLLNKEEDPPSERALKAEKTRLFRGLFGNSQQSTLAQNFFQLGSTYSDKISEEYITELWGKGVITVEQHSEILNGIQDKKKKNEKLAILLRRSASSNNSLMGFGGDSLLRGTSLGGGTSGANVGASHRNAGGLRTVSTEMRVDPMGTILAYTIHIRLPE